LDDSTEPSRTSHQRCLLCESVALMGLRNKELMSPKTNDNEHNFEPRAGSRVLE